MSHFTQEQQEEIRLLARVEAKRMLRRMLKNVTGSTQTVDEDDDDLTPPE